MDFKLCGHRRRHHRFPQLDLKTPRHQHKIIAEAILPARRARTKILEVCAVLSINRGRNVEYAPASRRSKSSGENRALIGPGGKTIKSIVAETGREITSKTTAPCTSTHQRESMARAKEIIGGMTRESRSARPIKAASVSVKEFGAFVEVSRPRTASSTFTSLRGFPRQNERRRRKSRRHDLGQVHRHRTTKAGQGFAQSRAQRTRRSGDRTRAAAEQPAITICSAAL